MFSLSWKGMCEESELIRRFIEIRILIALL